MGRAPRENPSRPSPITRTIHECHEFSRLLRLFEFEENLNLANLIVNGSVDLLKTKDRWIFAGLSSLVNRNRDPRFSSFVKKYIFFFFNSKIELWDKWVVVQSSCIALVSLSEKFFPPCVSSFLSRLSQLHYIYIWSIFILYLFLYLLLSLYSYILYLYYIILYLIYY